MKNQKQVGGFTLIELLVSISIIAILTALLTANFIGARQRARDGQRKAQIFNIQSALELYRSDNGLYPAVLAACGVALTSGGVPPTVYMQKLPCDPSTGNDYSYTHDVSTNTYTIMACLENDQDGDKDATTDPSCSSASFTQSNP